MLHSNEWRLIGVPKDLLSMHETYALRFVDDNETYYRDHTGLWYTMGRDGQHFYCTQKVVEQLEVVFQKRMRGEI